MKRGKAKSEATERGGWSSSIRGLSTPLRLCAQAAPLCLALYEGRVRCVYSAAFAVVLATTMASLAPTAMASLSMASSLPRAHALSHPHQLQLALPVLCVRQLLLGDPLPLRLPRAPTTKLASVAARNTLATGEPPQANEKKMNVRSDVRNIAIVAHVDRGKATLVDAMLRQAEVFRDNQSVEERIMDSNGLERERGITTLSKNTAIRYKGTKINIIDTPEHSDFGGEVERILNMVDGVLLLVDSVEGPMPQTRFALKKALELGQTVVVVVNKVDQPSARPDYVVNATFELFVELNASDEQCNFQVVYASDIHGKAGLEPDQLADDLEPLFESVIRCIPEPRVDLEGPVQMRDAVVAVDLDMDADEAERLRVLRKQQELASRIASGEFTVSPRTDFLKNARRLLAHAGPLGRALALKLATYEAHRRAAQAQTMPESRGDVGAIVGEPFFLPLYKLFKIYGGVFRLTFGPKSFVIVSDPLVAKHLLKDNAKGYSKGILAEILEFVMGTGLIPADGEVWRVRRRAIVPAVHRKYVAAMMGLFGRATQRMCDKLDEAAAGGVAMEMELLFSRFTLDVIGKAVFNYDFDSLTNDTGIVEAVYITLREAEERSTAILPYWKIPILKAIVPRQRRVTKALNLINEILDNLIAICKRMVEEEDVQFGDEYMNDRDPSILHFLLAAGDEVSSKQLRDDLMTMLIAGHETSAAVLTWTFYLLAQNPGVMTKLQEEVDRVLGDRHATVEDMKKLRYTTRVINESLRLYPQPPVLIRRSLDGDMLGKFRIDKGEDIFISTWNIHRSPKLWEEPESFMPERWPLDGPDPTEVNQNYRYLPFGGGQRKCLGDMFATFEVVTALAMLVRRFNFTLAPGAPPVEMTTGATIHTSAGLLMSVSRRQTGSNEHPDEVCNRDGNLASTPMSDAVNEICPQVTRS